MWSSLVIIHHELGLDGHVPASSKSLFKSLSSRLLPLGLKFRSSVKTNYYITCTGPHFCNNKHYQLFCTKFVFVFRIMKHTPNPTISSEGFSISQPPQMRCLHMRVGTLIAATIYLQLIQNRYMFRSFTVLQCSHQHCVQPVASDVEVVRYL